MLEFDNSEYTPQSPSTLEHVHLVYFHPHLPLEFCISDQYSGIAGIFAELSYRQPGEDFRVTVLELIKEVDVCVRVASFFQARQKRPTWLRRICINDLVEVVCYICQGETKCHKNSNNNLHSSKKKKKNL